MQIRHVSITHFRGIARLDWAVQGSLLCLIGAGDSCKTTILDAIELALLPRSFFPLSEADFHEANTAVPFSIVITFGDIPEALLLQERFGLEIRGWSQLEGVLHDEPADEDEAVLSIRATGDESMEVSWSIVSDRNVEGRPLSVRDRIAIAAARIGDDVERQFYFARGSPLTRLVGESQDVAGTLAEAHQAARLAVREGPNDVLQQIAKDVEVEAKLFGANFEGPLRLGLDPRTLRIGAGALGLEQADGTFMRASGLGSRRLLALAIQRKSFQHRSLTLLDEVETGLEPHRVRHLLVTLKASVAGTGGQALLTSHSDVAVAELGSEGLAVVRRAPNGDVSVLHPPGELQGMIRSCPEAMLAKRVVVCEGSTEWGFSRALLAHWAVGHNEPLARRGTVFVDGGGGDKAANRALQMRALQYESCFWGDSDHPLNPSAEALRAEGCGVVMWAGELCLEQRLFLDHPEPKLVWDLATEFVAIDRMASQVANALDFRGTQPKTWQGWVGSGIEEARLRATVGAVANKCEWFKTIERGERLGDLVVQGASQLDGRPFGAALAALEAWCYDH